jgi:predicted dienelactone hydrolase
LNFSSLVRDQAKENSHGEWIDIGDPIYPQEFQIGSHSGQSLASQDPSQPIKTINQADACIKVIIAVNSVINPIFSASSMRPIATSSLIIAASDDLFAPS